jgi:hypothetical protein
MKIVNPIVGLEYTFEFIDLKTKKTHSRKITKKSEKNLNVGEVGYQTVAGRSFLKKGTGDRVRFEIKGKEYLYKITSIHYPKNVRTISEHEIIEFRRRINRCFSEYSTLKDYEFPFDSVFKHLINSMTKTRLSGDLKMLSAELLRTTETISKKKDTADELLEVAAQIYSDTRSNLVALYK